MSMRTVTEHICDHNGNLLETRQIELPESQPSLADDVAALGQTVEQIDQTVAIIAAEVLGVPDA